MAALLILTLVPAGEPGRSKAVAGKLLNFRPVFQCRPAMGYVWAYTVHSFELFAFRSWMVAFLTFAQSLHSGPGPGLSAATLAAIITVVGQPASILGNEGALRIGRHRWITIVMFIAAAVAAGLGFLAAVPFWLLFGLCCVYMYVIAADSAAITAGMVGVAPEGYMGATMAVHSCLGFAGASLGPLLFGAMLDLAGGSGAVMSWGFAFAMVAALVLLGPIALWWSRQNPDEK